ncbi:cytochrome P450 monooxygenase [Nemania abortiva]|nr:cytochrome P450 monooxygenase [Nemania abortiva]
MAAIDIFMRGILLTTAMMIGVKITLLLFKKTRGNLPPGPRGLPLLGNIRDLPPKGEREWEHWLKHKDIYGPISSITVLGTTMVILHSPELALELLEKRSSIYSSRPKFVLGDMVGWSNISSLMPYGNMHRLYRRYIHMMVGTQKTVAPYLSLLEIEVHRLLFRILQEPDLLLNHLRTEAGAVILKMVYGYTVEPHKPDPLVHLIETSMDQFNAGVTLGARLVEVIPALKYVPEWMPGAGWKKVAKMWKATLEEAAGKPLKFAQERIAHGNAEKSFVADFHRIRGDNLVPEDYQALKWNAWTMYGGGSDTTAKTLASVFLAMSIFPAVQHEAQEEIDRIIGTSRLPTFSDRASLPYIDAIVTEAWRWHPVAPMGFYHATTTEDVVDGYYIPKGAVIIPNVWWFTHDPAIYANPSVFNPSRFLGPNPAPDPINHIFGYGRRVCSGRYLAISSVWLAVARSLAVFKISKGLDKSGREIEPTVKFSPGPISRPEEFKATIQPRSPQHEALIRQLEELHPWENSNADELRGIVI